MLLLKYLKINLICILIIFIFLNNLQAQNQWFVQNSQFTVNLSEVFFINNNTGWIAGDSGKIYRTNNQGVNWNSQFTNIDSRIENIFFIDENKGWAVSWNIFPDSSSYLGTIYLTTTNGGLVWQKTMFPDSNRFLKTIFFKDSLNGFAGGAPGGIFKTSDGGIRWNLTALDTTSKIVLPVESIQFYDNLTGYASGGFRDLAGSMWSTTNGGSVWKISVVGPEPLNDFFINNFSKIIAVGGDFEFGSSYVKTTNSGTNWLYDTLGVFGVARAIDFRTANEGWIAIGDKFSYTLDTGNSWRSTYTPDSLRIQDLCFTDSLFGWAVGDNGIILKYDATIVSVENLNESLPALSFSLSQNYPNPFNPNTIIYYELHSQNKYYNTDNVSLKVYNILGAEVATLVNKYQIPGIYKIDFDGSNFPNGVYFYELKVGEFSQVRKMLLLK